MENEIIFGLLSIVLNKSIGSGRAKYQLLALKTFKY